jgi:serine/threonine-protein kinase
LIRVCLAKDPDERWQSVRDVERELRWIAGDGRPGGTSPALEATADRKRDLPVGVAVAGLIFAVAVGIVLGILVPFRGVAGSRVARFSIAQPVGASLEESAALALCPDGTTIVYAARTSAGLKLYKRSLDSFATIPIAGTEAGTEPFFSPDGQWVGFLAGGKLKKVALTGGAAQTLCDAPNLRGAVWSTDSDILYTPGVSGGIWRIAAAGGTPQLLTTPVAQLEKTHRWVDIIASTRALILV